MRQVWDSSTIDAMIQEIEVLENENRTLKIVVAKYLAGHRPGEDMWSEHDQEAMHLAISTKQEEDSAPESEMMTVGDLIAILKQFDKELPVFSHTEDVMYIPITRVNEEWMREENGAFEILPHDDMATGRDFRGIPI